MKFLCYTYVKSVCFFIQRSFLCYLVFILQRKRTEPFTIAAALLIAASTSASEAFRPKKMPIVPIVVLQKLAANLFLWKNHWPLPTIFEKIISLVNFRDNGMYIPTPIYLHKNYFSYYLDLHHELKFDIDDLFYYSSHKILKRQGHLYVNDYGMQITILNRYGIKNYGVRDRDYRFVNGDDHDLRYSNIEIINRYHGVFVFTKNEKTRYRVRLHINGNYTIGTYRSETQAAAYNKAVDLARQHGICKNFPENYIEDLSARDYADIYTKAKISTNFLEYLKNLSTENNIV